MDFRHRSELPGPSDDEYLVCGAVLGQCLHSRHATYLEHGSWQSRCSDCGEVIRLQEAWRGSDLSGIDIEQRWRKELPRPAQIGSIGAMVVACLERKGWTILFRDRAGSVECSATKQGHAFRSSAHDTQAKAVTDVAARIVRANLYR